jgi:hypothetical protein
MRSSTAIACALLTLVPLLSSCGGEDGTAAGSAARSTSVANAEHPAPAGSCKSHVGGFVASLASLRGSLSRGLSYTEYLPAVRQVRIAYRAIKPRELDASCLLLSGGPAERAFNLYIDAANAWGECLTTAGCTTASIEAKLQGEWSRASNHLSVAQQAVNRPSR